MKKIKIVIADDHAIVREGIAALLSATGEIEVAGEASTGEEAVRLAKMLEPDVVLMDIRMPGNMDGIAATAAIRKTLPCVKVIILSAYDDTEYLTEVLRVNASGYLLKGTMGTDLFEAIRAVHRGEIVFHPKLTVKLVDQAYPKRKRAAKPEKSQLSKRELEVIGLGRRGMSNKEIARHLSLSERTVHTHWRNVFFKLGVKSRVQAIMTCIEKRVIPERTE